MSTPTDHIATLDQIVDALLPAAKQGDIEAARAVMQAIELAARIRLGEM